MNAVLLLFLFANIFFFAGVLLFRLDKFELAETVYYLQSIYFLFVLFYLLNLWQKSKDDMKRKQEQAQKTRQYCEAYDELRTLVRERQHDMDNHLSAIFGMIYTIDDRDELIRCREAYYEELKEGREEIKLYLSVENRAIAGFLFVKIQEAKKYQIKITNRIIMKEKALPISEYDFIDMTGILLDNAVEALAGSREIPKRIHLEIVNGKEGLFITSANTSRPLSTEEMTLFFQEDYTSKGRGRGIGLKKLKKIVHRMGGNVIVSGEPAKEAWYIKFEVAIPVKRN